MRGCTGKQSESCSSERNGNLPHASGINGYGGGYVPMIVQKVETEVKILNPWDSQGNQVTDSNGVCHTIRGCGGGGYQQGYIMQRTTGTLSPGAHAGSYNGQDAYNDMLIRQDELFDASNRKIQTVGPGICSEGERPQGCNGSDSHRGGYKLKTTVRRLTPLECERLQGFPDGWTDIGEWTDTKGKKHKEADTPRYKALGNSICLPFWEWLARRIAAQYERPMTMGSLFDGIGGFPLAFQKAGAIPVWASEIEPFCIAVTKKHFGEE